MADEETDQEKRYRYFLEERRHLVQARLNEEQKFIGFLITLSSGALVFTISFFEEVYRPENVCESALIFGSWLMFLICIFACLWENFLSSRAYEHQLEILEKQWLQGQPVSENPLRQSLRASRFIAFLAFGLGALLLVLFAVLGMSSEINN